MRSDRETGTCTPLCFFYLFFGSTRRAPASQSRSRLPSCSRIVDCPLVLHPCISLDTGHQAMPHAMQLDRPGRVEWAAPGNAAMQALSGPDAE